MLTLRRTFPVLLAAGVALLALGDAALARIKLITLPVRQRVEIQLDHPNATLVEEERVVPLVKGLNQVDFSWANTQIDPGTIVFRVLGPEGPASQPGAAPAMDVHVLSVSYPPNENALVWQVSASASGAARVRISYLLGNLTKSFAYRAVASSDEKTLALAQYLRLQNQANEDFANSQVWAGWGKTFQRPIGLNETKEVLVERYTGVPVRKTYTCDPAEHGYLDQPQQKLRVPMHYVLKNDVASHLGKTPLPYGKVRIFIESRDAEKTTAFLGEDWGKFTPLDDEMRLFLGVAQDVVVKRTIANNNRKPVAGNLFHQEVTLKYELENCKDQPIRLDVQETLAAVRLEVLSSNNRPVEWVLGPNTTFAGGPDVERSTAERIVLHADLPPRAADGKPVKVVHTLHLVFKNEW